MRRAREEKRHTSIGDPYSVMSDLSVVVKLTLTLSRGSMTSL